MAGNARFHNKYHRRNHHTIPSEGFPDSGSDPIASPAEPFQGDFYLAGSLSASENLYVQGDTIVFGNLSALGDFSVIDTYTTVTSSLSIINDGTEPALTVRQNGIQNIAIFMDDTNNALKIKDGPKIELFTSLAQGLHSFAVGSKTEASGVASNSEGFGTFAFGDASHAEGKNTDAFDTASHAEGVGTEASGIASHAEGGYTLVVGSSGGHAEGNRTLVTGHYGHAEGSRTIAQGEGSHAQGLQTYAKANYTHAEGFSTSATNLYAHAQGNATQASGQFSHAEGLDSVASNAASHAEGASTLASGAQSHAEGANTQATNTNAHAEGSGTIASGAASHAEGTNTQATNTNAHAEGSGAIASGAASHAEGNATQATDSYAHAEGDETYAVNQASHAEGAGTIASGYASHAEGNNTQAAGDKSHAEGTTTQATNTNAHAEGSGTIASGAASHAEGSASTASGDSSHAQGLNTTASGNYSHAAGSYSNAITENSTAIGLKANALHRGATVFSANVNNYNSNSFGNETFNVFASGGNYFYNRTMIGDPLSATSVIVTSAGLVGIRTDNPNEALTVVGNVSATQEFIFGSLERPSLTGLKAAVDDLLYIIPQITPFTINGSSDGGIVLEVGQALTPTITVAWNSNKIEKMAMKGYRLTLPNGTFTTGNYTYSTFNDPNTYDINTLPGTNTQEVSTWSISGYDWKGGVDVENNRVYWMYRVYFGASNATTPNASQIISNADSTSLATSRLGLGARTVLPANEYFYVAYPTRFGSTTTLRVNGLNFNDFTTQTIVGFTNAQGGTADYTVLRSNNLLNASYTVEIT